MCWAAAPGWLRDACEVGQPHHFSPNWRRFVRQFARWKCLPLLLKAAVLHDNSRAANTDQ
jgi:hypothetical protein